MLPEYIKKMREARGWKGTDLARETGLDQSLLSKYERNERPTTKEAIGKLAMGFNVPLHEMLAIEAYDNFGAEGANVLAEYLARQISNFGLTFHDLVVARGGIKQRDLRPALPVLDAIDRCQTVLSPTEFEALMRRVDAVIERDREAANQIRIPANPTDPYPPLPELQGGGAAEAEAMREATGAEEIALPTQRPKPKSGPLALPAAKGTRADVLDLKDRLNKQGGKATRQVPGVKHDIEPGQEPVQEPAAGEPRESPKWMDE